MEKIKMESDDLYSKNIEKLEALFPNVVTEISDGNNSLRKSVNFDMLKSLLSNDTSEPDEIYEFTWAGKNKSIAEGLTPIRKALRPCVEGSKDWDTTQNLYIEGDNLDVLKLLQKSYLNSIDVIYIDPPYNTGKDFIYRDNFILSSSEWKEKSGEFNIDGNRLFQNNGSNGRFHSDWCSMMYPRLMLSYNLLSKNGVIFISIDDNEYDNLKKICNEIFGDSSYVSTLVWQKKTGASDAKGIATITEYILVYCKSPINISNIFTKNTASYDLKRYKYKDEYFEKRGPYYIDNLDRGGLQYSDSLNYAIECPDGKLTYPNGRTEYVNDGWIWKWSKNKVEWAKKNGFIEFRRSAAKPSGWAVCYKNYLMVNNEDKPIERAAPHKNLITDVLNANASSTMKELFGINLFDYSKPYELIKKLLSYVSCRDGIVLDFFSGSATTAQAVMQLNAEDGGKRRFIMVQLPEECGVNTEAAKSGYNNVCEIGKERIRRAGKKILSDFSMSPSEQDFGFRVLKLDSSNMKDVYYSPSEYSQLMLDDMVSNIKGCRSSLDVLYGCLTGLGLPLSLNYSSETYNGADIHIMGNNELIACFENNISVDTVKHIASRNPDHAVFMDGCFDCSSSKINIGEIFKLLSPKTSLKVI